MPKLGKVKKYEFPNNITEIDHMSGREFEEFIANVFKFTEGYIIKERPGEEISKDYGIDIVLKDQDDTLYGVQCKRYGANTLLKEEQLNKMLNGAKVHKITKKEDSIDPEVADTYYLVLVTTALEKQLSGRALEFVRRHKIEAYYRDSVISFLKEVHEKQGKEIKEYNYINPAFEQTAKAGGSYTKNSEFISFLKKERDKISKYNNIPLPRVFSNKTLEELVTKQPITIDELKNIEGFSDKKVKLFGAYLIKRIAIFLGKPIVEDRGDSKTDEELTKELKELRREVLKKYDNYFKAYNVYKNSVIDELIEKRPQTKEQLMNITSFSEKKTEQFGNYVLEILKYKL